MGKDCLMTDRPPPVIHERAYVDSPSTIGAGTKIWHFTHILPNTHIGENCVLGQNVMAGPNCRIGDKCQIHNNEALYKGVQLADGVVRGPSCVFTNVLTPRDEVDHQDAIARISEERPEGHKC